MIREYVKLPKSSDKLAPIKDFDAIIPIYGTKANEWNYYKDGVLVQKVTVNYTDSSKKIIDPILGVTYERI